jgi:uncharacterized protein YraI
MPPTTRWPFSSWSMTTYFGAANQRSGPGTSYSITGRLPGGGLAWLTCQQAGSKVGTTRIWDKISYRHWVTDYYLATPSSAGYSKPAPRC